MAGEDIHAAIASGELERVRAALAAGADPNARDRNGASPLHGAAARGELELARSLLDAGAELEARDLTPYGALTPLLLASIYARAELVELLLARGADPSASVPVSEGEGEGEGEWAGWAAVHWAAHGDSLPCLKAILRADPHSVGRETAAGQRPHLLTKDRLCRALLMTVGMGGSVEDFEARSR